MIIFHKKHKYEEKKNPYFLTADIKESSDVKLNPSRGWYHIYEMNAEKPLDKKQMNNCLSKYESIAMLIFNIGSYKNNILDRAAINNLRDGLSFFIENGYEIILRVVYDKDGKGLEHEPDSFEIVKKHLMQIADIVMEFSSNIFVYQGLLIGSWGEMHNSRYLRNYHLKQLTDIFLEKTNNNNYLAVRRPSYWRMLRKRLPEQNDEKICLFDDAIFGSKTHMGTFNDNTSDASDWESQWHPNEELSFEDKLCRVIPHGGEVVFSKEYSLIFDFSKTLEYMRNMHITYLNGSYDEKVLKIWKNWKVKNSGVWNGSNAYDYIGAHLGYRYVITSCNIEPLMESSISEKPQYYKITIEIKNNGLAPCYWDANPLLVWNDNEKILDYNLRNLMPEQTITLTDIIPAFKGELWVSAKRLRDDKKIYFGNESKLDGDILVGTFTE